VKITHAIGSRKKEGEGIGSFLLTDKRGNYFSQAKNFSNYCGLFTVQENQDAYHLIKSIDRLSLEADPDEVINNFHRISQRHGTAFEHYSLREGVLIYTLENAKGTAVLDLDCRKTETQEEWGRTYTITKESVPTGFSDEQTQITVITYTKFKDEALQHVQYQWYIVVVGLDDYSICNQWQERNYSYDKLRNAGGSDYVYRALTWQVQPGQQLFISTGPDKVKAIQQIMRIKSQFLSLDKQFTRQVNNSVSTQHLTISNDLYAMAYAAAQSAIDALTVSFTLQNKPVTGIYAGLPWFYQFWSRDESISLHALTLQERYLFVKDVLDRNMSLLLPTGRVPNRYPHSMLGSADGVGWVFTRTHDFLTTLDKKKLLEKYYSKQELEGIQKKLQHSINMLQQHFGDEHNLIYNYAKETWMDTNDGEDNRSGIRIEIQALWIRMHQLDRFLSSKIRPFKKTSNTKEKELIKTVKKLLYNDGVLADGFSNGRDDTQRPNIFLAYYICPGLLSANEWKKAFDYALGKIWLDWGGVSTIDKNNPLFCERSTGMQSISYHRGDSWYWVNNLAALCMFRLDKKQYSKNIIQILDASCKELLFGGFVGHHAEVSDAAEQNSRGCLAQAWSSALLFELFEELKSILP